MSDPDAVELADLTVTGLRRVNAMVKETHDAVLDRNYRLLRALGPAIGPIHASQRGLNHAVYAAVDVGLRLSGFTAKRLARSWPPAERAERVWLATVLGVVNGFYGDRLGVPSAAASTMTLRHRGATVPLTHEALRGAVDEATPKIAVFLHGLVETEHIWFGSAAAGQEGEPSFGGRLRADLGYTPVWVRYNSGLPVATNAAKLIDLIKEIVEVWPCEVDEIVLIGHSMGGLVLHTALAAQPGWADLVSATVSLGTPFLGAPLARGTAALGRQAAKLAEARWLHTMLDQVSAGVRDLRAGPDAGMFEPMREHGSHLFVAGVAVTERFAFLGSLVGDGLVVESSAVGGPAYSKMQSHTIWGVHHQRLFSDARVYAEIRDWLAAARG